MPRPIATLQAPEDGGVHGGYMPIAILHAPKDGSTPPYAKHRITPGIMQRHANTPLGLSEHANIPCGLADCFLTALATKLNPTPS